MGHASRTNSGERPRELTQRRFNHGAALTLDAQAKAIQQTRAFMADLSVRLDELSRAITAEEVARKFDVSECRGRQTATHAAQQGQLAQLAADHLKFKFRSFGERFRWLLTGK